MKSPNWQPTHRERCLWLPSASEALGIFRAKDDVDARVRTATCGRARASRHAERAESLRGNLRNAPGSGGTRRVRARGAFKHGDAWLVEAGTRHTTHGEYL